MGIIRKVTGAPLSPPTLPPRYDAAYKVPASVEKVADADNKQVYDLNSFDDTIKLFDIDDAVEFAYQVSEEVVQDKFRILLSLQCYSSTSMLHAKCSGDGLHLWVNIWSYVQKHEWEPPP
ncbi:unnamed protein product [Cuscuta campestris]|uniref:Uncharacterized protein n=1 Tax=Cuscuta campestris TaxID=132261 RepID=A0A484MCC4_9ASTE|nr:unnamed protein product [Cuscuta campestris]